MDTSVGVAIHRLTAMPTETNWNCVLLKDRIHAPKHVAEAHLMFVLIKSVEFFSEILCAFVG